MNLNSIIAEILKINEQEFTALVEGRGMRPVKAAIRLGAEPEKAQIFAGLKLATSVSEIDAVYANTNVRSCMTGSMPGQFYHDNGIGVIYSNNYRCLVNLKTSSLAIRHGWSGYGYHRDQISPVLQRHVAGKEFWNKTVTYENVEYGTGKFSFKPHIKVYTYGWKIIGVDGLKGNTRFGYYDLRWGIWNREQYKQVLKYLEEYLTMVEKSINKTIKVSIDDSSLLGEVSSITFTLRCVKEERGAYSHYCDYESRYTRPGYYHDLGRKGISGQFEENKEYRMKVIDFFLATFIVDVKAIKVEERKTKIKYYKDDLIIKNEGVFIPFLDIEGSREELPDSIFAFEEKIDKVEDYYLGRLGDSYKERMNHPRRNLSHGRKSAA